MKLKEEFIVHEADGESMLIPTADAGFSGIVRGNKTMGRILELLKEDTTEEEIIAKMLEIYNAPKEKIEQDVKKVIENLQKIDALV